MIRVGAIERIRRWAGKIMGQVEELSVKVSRLRLGAAADRAISQDLGDLFQRRFEVRASSSMIGRRMTAVEIPITLVDEGIECRLQMGIDEGSLKDAAAILLGAESPSPEAVADMLRELANVAGGAFVSAAEADGISVTIGFPVNAPEGAWSEATGTAQEFVLGIVDTPFEIAIRVVIESHELRSVIPAQLRAGMVVARAICNREGAVLLPPGTRLTDASAERLRDALSHGATVIVLAAPEKDPEPRATRPPTRRAHPRSAVPEKA